MTLELSDAEVILLLYGLSLAIGEKQPAPIAREYFLELADKITRERYGVSLQLYVLFGDLEKVI